MQNYISQRLTFFSCISVWVTLPKILKEISWYAICNLPVCSIWAWPVGWRSVPREVPNVQGWGCLWLSPACPAPWLLCWVSLTGESLSWNPHGEPLQLPIPRGAARPHFALTTFYFKEVFCINHNYVIFSSFPMTMNCSQLCTICKRITVWR